MGKFRRGFAVGAITAAALAGGTAFAVSNSIPGPDGTIHACYDASTGALRAIDSSASCNRGENGLNWNQTGPQGPKGDTGPQGAAGPKSDAGNPGATGQDLANALGTGVMQMGGGTRKQSWTLVPGLTATVYVPKGGAVYFSTTGAVQAPKAGCIKLRVVVDTSFPQASRQLCSDHNAVTYWSIGQGMEAGFITAGSHTFTVVAEALSGSAVNLSGGSGDTTQGQLTVLVLAT